MNQEGAPDERRPHLDFLPHAAAARCGLINIDQLRFPRPTDARLAPRVSRIPRHGPQPLPITPRNPAHTFDAHTGQLRRFSGKPRWQLPIRSHQHPLETFPHRSWTRHMSPTPYPSSPDPSRSATTPQSGRAPN
ncbi:hypothetical protein E4T56_gene17676 [Termitomyces sp. T112]|nr:hypothetical protein E4T56_gene17676 [Termitomyces sp. T112]